MRPDSEPRSVIVPDDLLKAIEENARARAAFKKMAYSHQKAYVDWIEQAKGKETREARITKSIRMIVKRSKVR